MDHKNEDVAEVARIEDMAGAEIDPKDEAMVKQGNAALYVEAIQRYPVDEAIDQEEEKRLKRKLDIRILPLLGICYFFYVRLSLRSTFRGNLID